MSLWTLSVTITRKKLHLRFSPVEKNVVLESFMKGFGSELWTGISGLKNVDIVALGDDQTAIASGVTTTLKNTEFGKDEKDWNDELFEDKDLIGVEFDKRIEPRSEA